MFRALVWVVEQASVACVWIATCGQMTASLCALSYLMQSRWRYVLDVLCCHERDHTAESFGRCFGNVSAGRALLRLCDDLEGFHRQPLPRD